MISFGPRQAAANDAAVAAGTTPPAPPAAIVMVVGGEVPNNSAFGSGWKIKQNSKCSFSFFQKMFSPSHTHLDIARLVFVVCL